MPGNIREELIQHLDSHIRTTHLQALKGETYIASVINDTVIRIINKIRKDPKFHNWMGQDVDFLDELGKTFQRTKT